MKKYNIRTIIVSDIHIEGYIVEIYINEIEVAYLYQKDPSFEPEVVILNNIFDFPEKILEHASVDAQNHLFHTTRKGMSQYHFSDRTSPREYNEEGQKLIERILKDPRKKILRKYYHHLKQDVTDVFENNGKGCGARFKEDAELVGLLDKKEKNVTL